MGKNPNRAQINPFLVLGGEFVRENKPPPIKEGKKTSKRDLRAPFENPYNGFP